MQEILKKKNGLKFTACGHDYEVIQGKIYRHRFGSITPIWNLNIPDEELDEICDIIKGNA
jgi:hypothetical protein